MPNMEEIMVPEADHWTWSKLPRPVQECVWKVYNESWPEPTDIKAVVCYYYEGPDGKKNLLFAGTYLTNEDGPDLDIEAGETTTMFGERICIKRIDRSHSGGIDYYDVFIDEPQGEKS